MKLNTKVFRYLTSDDWRVLTATEMGSKNHEVVPTSLITQLAGLRTGANTVQKCISTLAKADLIARVRNAKYDGYRLTYGGLDYLALHAHTKAEAILHLGSQMGVGKESDIYLVTAPAEGTGSGAGKPSAKPVQSILKIHRLGRTSFRSLARNRDYHRHRQHCSWQYLSRLSAQKEFAAMRALHRAGFPVPRPIAWNRHTIVMSLVPGLPLKDLPLSAFSAKASETSANTKDTVNAAETPESSNDQRDQDIAGLYAACIDLALQLASHGLIHGDLNEFNILIEHVPGAFETETPPIPDFYSGSEAQLETPLETTTPNRLQMKPHLIDFPQITSLSHPSAEEFFARDISGIKAFFRKRYHFESEEAGPTLADALLRLRIADTERTTPRLDVEIEAAGFSKKMSKDLDRYLVDGVDEDDGEAEVVVQELPQVGDDNIHRLNTPDANVDNHLHDNGLDPRHQLEAKDEAKDAYHFTLGDRADPVSLSNTPKLASLSLQNDRPLNRKTKAGTGWSI